MTTYQTSHDTQRWNKSGSWDPGSLFLTALLKPTFLPTYETVVKVVTFATVVPVVTIVTVVTVVTALTVLTVVTVVPKDCVTKIVTNIS